MYTTTTNHVNYAPITVSTVQSANQIIIDASQEFFSSPHHAWTIHRPQWKKYTYKLRGGGYTHSVLVGARRTTRPPIKGRIWPLKMLVGIIYVVLKVTLPAVALIMPTEELCTCLEVLLAHLIEPQVKVSKLVSDKLAELELLWCQWASNVISTHRIGLPLGAF